MSHAPRRRRWSGGCMTIAGAAIVVLVLSIAPFRRGALRVDLANGVAEHSSRTWWGLVSSVRTRTTWVGLHHSADEVEPVWRHMGSSIGGSLLSRGRIGTSRFKFARFDDAELTDVDSAGVIPAELRTPVADAVRRQWLRMADDGRDPRSTGNETIAQQLRYWDFADRVLTLEELLQLEQGTPWNEVLYPE